MIKKEEIISNILISIGENTNLNMDEIREVEEILEIELCRYNIERKKHKNLKSDEQLLEAIEKYLKIKLIEGCEKDTLRNYKYQLLKFDKEIKKQLQEITEEDVLGYIIKEGKMLKKSSQNRRRAVFRGFFKWLKNEGKINVDISSKIKDIRVQEKAKEYVTVEEIEELRSVCDEKRDRAILEVFLGTKCTVSELKSMDIEDINFQKSILKVKGNKGRVVHLNETTGIYIKKYLDERKDKNSPLFVSLSKPYNRLGTRGIQKMVSNLGEKAKIQNRVTTNMLRQSLSDDKIIGVTTIQSILIKNK